MPESEEGPRRFLRAAVEKERRSAEIARANRNLRTPWLGLLGGMDQGLMRLDIAAREVGRREAARTAVPVTLDQPAAPQPAAQPAPIAAPVPLLHQPAVAPGGRLAHELVRALAVFGAVTAIGAGVAFSLRDPGDLKIWLAVAVGLVVCAALFIGAQRSLADQRHDAGNPPIVS